MLYCMKHWIYTYWQFIVGLIGIGGIWGVVTLLYEWVYPVSISLASDACLIFNKEFGVYKISVKLRIKAHYKEHFLPSPIIKSKTNGDYFTLFDTNKIAYQTGYMDCEFKTMLFNKNDLDRHIPPSEEFRIYIGRCHSKDFTIKRIEYIS